MPTRYIPIYFNEEDDKFYMKDKKKFNDIGREAIKEALKKDG